MKTKYRYIHFIHTKDSIWNILNNRSKTVLGGIAYYPKWRQYVFFTNPEVKAIFNDSCLNDIIDFIRQLKERDE